MSVYSQAQAYRKSSHIAFRDQSQAQLDAGTELDPQTQSQLSGYQLVDDPLHPHGKLVPKPDPGFFGTLGKDFLLPVAGAAGGILAAPYIAGAFGAGAGGAGAGAGAGAGGAGSAAATAGGGLGHFLGTAAGLGLVGQGVGALTNFFSQRSANNANMHAADLESQAAQAALNYTKQRDAQARQDQLDAQAKNYQLYLDQQARLAPYRQLGAGSIGQMMHAPMTLNPQANSIGSLMGGR